MSSLPGQSGGGTEVMSSLGTDAITTMKYSGKAEIAVTTASITTAGLRRVRRSIVSPPT